MPGFNIHWLVAQLSAKSIPSAVGDGKDYYLNKVIDFSNLISSMISTIFTYEDFHEFSRKDDGSFKKLFEKLFSYLSSSPTALCFSAYMLGACGPDFWTVPGPGYKTAAIHFDMGHYNRSHRQFEVAIERWRGQDPNNFQVKVEQAYFMGMATHIAADLVMHQLVNVYAGAYNFVTDTWANEHGWWEATGKVARFNHDNSPCHK